MTRRTLSLRTEPCGDAYGLLVDWLSRTGSTAGLVVRESGPESTEQDALLASLQSEVVGDEQVEAWPGTRLFGHTARLVRFRLGRDSSAVLRDATDHLYGWIHPLPEDLCVWRDDGSVLLASIAHELDAWIEVDFDEARLLGEFLDLESSSG
jgi:hypothetical protein